GDARADGPAPDEDRAAFEAELFGAVETSTAISPPSAAPTSSRSDFEEELFGAPPPPPSAERAGETESSGILDALQDSLRNASDRLAIGGTLFLRIEYRALDEGEPSDFALVSPITLDLYLDARPMDRVRTYVRGRLAYDPTAAADETADSADLTDPNATATLGGGGRPVTQVLLDQLWVKFDLARSVFLTVGKQRVRWGTGRIWNPTDFLNAQRFNPLALFDPRLGVSLVKLHVPFEDAGANLYAIVNLDGADQLDRVGAAARAEIAFDTTELAASASWRDGEPLRFGVDASAGVGDFELRAELALLYDDPLPVFSGDFDPSQPAALTGVRVRYREDSVLPQLVLGADVTLGYGDGQEAILGLEYFFNSTGYDGAELYPVLALAPTLGQQFPAQAEQIGLRTPTPAVFQPFYLGRHYLSLLALFPTPLGLEDHSLVLTGLVNLSDRSALVRVDHTVRLFRFLSFRSYINAHFGDLGEFRLGFELGPISPLGAGISLVPPLFELGFALSTTL
ncbi:MAG: hypothetical protein AAFU79_16640, partial [Myxococcota bacterium]